MMMKKRRSETSSSSSSSSISSSSSTTHVNNETKLSAISIVFSSKQLTTAILHILSPSGFQHARSGVVRINRFFRTVCTLDVFRRIIDMRDARSDSENLPNQWPLIHPNMVHSILQSRETLCELHLTRVDIAPLAAALGNVSFPRLERLSLIACNMNPPSNDTPPHSEIERQENQFIAWIQTLLERENNPVRVINITGSKNMPYILDTDLEFDDNIYHRDWRIIGPTDYRYIRCPGKHPGDETPCVKFAVLESCQGGCDLLMFTDRHDIIHKSRPHVCLNQKQRACLCTLPVVAGKCLSCGIKICKPCATRKSLTFSAVCHLCDNQHPDPMVCSNCLTKKFSNSMMLMKQFLDWPECTSCGNAVCGLHRVCCCVCSDSFCHQCQPFDEHREYGHCRACSWKD